VRRSRQDFADLGMAVDAALVNLDLADALLVDGHPEEVPMICQQAIACLAEAGLTEKALPALALLREATAMGKASRALIRETRDTVRRETREQRLYLSADREE
jgi:hypothetical protein